jgi:hypothetical protein
MFRHRISPKRLGLTLRTVCAGNGTDIEAPARIAVRRVVVATR